MCTVWLHDRSDGVFAPYSYWKHLQSVGAAPEDAEPFSGLNVTSNGGRVKREDRRQAFTAGDVLRLLAEARARGDAELADLIELGRWTGARIEELCSLKVENVKLAAKIPHLIVTAGKTDAALREVPIHRDLKPVLRRLIGKRKDGYVFAGLSVNKYGNRSDAIDKRFGRRKTALDFGENLVFHSIRKTVSTLLENAGVPENVASDIMATTSRR